MGRKQGRRGEFGKRRPTHGLKEDLLAFMEDVSIFHELFPLYKRESVS
jgi:hypothetical protein